MQHDHHNWTRRDFFKAAGATGAAIPLSGALGVGPLAGEAGAATPADTYKFFTQPCVWNRRVDVAPAGVHQVLNNRWNTAFGVTGTTSATKFRPSRLNWPGDNGYKRGVPIDQFSSRATEIWHMDYAPKLATNNNKPYPAPLSTTIQQDNNDHDWIGLRSSGGTPIGLYEGNQVWLFPFFGQRNCLYFVRWFPGNPFRAASALDYSTGAGSWSGGRYTGFSSIISGLPQMPLLAHPDELAAAALQTGYKGVNHALMMIAPSDRITKELQTEANMLWDNAATAKVVYPATRTDGTNNLPSGSIPMGVHVRLKANNVLTQGNTVPTTGQAAAIYQTLLRYGAYIGLSGPAVAGNPESDRLVLLSSRGPYGGPEPVWDSTIVVPSGTTPPATSLDRLTAADFEVVSEPVTGGLAQASFLASVINYTSGVLRP